MPRTENSERSKQQRGSGGAAPGKLYAKLHANKGSHKGQISFCPINSQKVSIPKCFCPKITIFEYS